MALMLTLDDSIRSSVVLQEAGCGIRVKWAGRHVSECCCMCREFLIEHQSMLRSAVEPYSVQHYKVRRHELFPVACVPLWRGFTLRSTRIRPALPDSGAGSTCECHSKA